MSNERRPVEAILSFRSGGSSFVADGRYFPLLVATWYGETSEASLRRYHRWVGAMRERGRREDVQIVSINDSRNAQRPPATVRKVAVELMLESRRAAGDGLQLPTLVVVDSPLVRGALAAMSWMSGGR